MKLTKNLRVVIDDTTPHGDFSDALYYELDKVPDDKDIEKDAQSRIDGWIYTIENPPVIPPPTKEEIQKMIDDATAQKESLEAYIAERETELASKVIKE